MQAEVPQSQVSQKRNSVVIFSLFACFCLCCRLTRYVLGSSADLSSRTCCGLRAGARSGKE